ncbi:hypothetical protein HMPREF0063_10205 [Aeromicrobium marinum DSM 15272]|uniref:Uncharacterized protein n=1 Tax=Aeromicrobium marinum DSM 15272 TaxID=585531 RepID=E2S848_9ACTN|nr:hypothetical protein [Aeromicrobium marinum]EFQ84353.1 hypothetical protein HMPREF0063_10205 [Aeromicrobium marinum DSM 15272]
MSDSSQLVLGTIDRAAQRGSIDPRWTAAIRLDRDEDQEFLSDMVLVGVHMWVMLFVLEAGIRTGGGRKLFSYVSKQGIYVYDDGGFKVRITADDRRRWIISGQLTPEATEILASQSPLTKR